MNRGNIPGFYYDATKQKYFKIQPNHVAPCNAVYAQSAVANEQHENKKRKLGERQLQLRRRQTVVRSPVLTHPAVATIGLERELGRAQVLGSLHQWEALETQQLRTRSVVVPASEASFEVLDAIPLARGQYTAAALLHHGDVCSAEVFSLARGHRQSQDSFARTRVAVFNSPIVSMSLIGQQSSRSAADTKWLVCAQRPSTPGNVYFGTLQTETATVNDGFYLKLGSATSCLWSSATQHSSGWSAIAGTEDVFILNDNGDLAAHQALPAESRSVAWLDRNTVCYGYGARNVERGVRLWDIRSGGVSIRFSAASAVTGLHSLNNGQGLLAFDNRQLALYDTRADRCPLLKINHVHYGPKIQFAQITNDIVVAVDHNNAIFAYSLRQGCSIGAVATPSRKSKDHITSLRAMGRLKFHACQGRMMHFWE